VMLALSLHAPTQELRTRIVPSARAFPLDKLMPAVFDHVKAPNRQLFVEYCLVRGPGRVAPQGRIGSLRSF
jgi:adenine C2-methylase RlmN of 23S rRNA A2503 and tRNA A37